MRSRTSEKQWSKPNSGLNLKLESRPFSTLNVHPFADSNIFSTDTNSLFARKYIYCCLFLCSRVFIISCWWIYKQIVIASSSVEELEPHNFDGAGAATPCDSGPVPDVYCTCMDFFKWRKLKDFNYFPVYIYINI
jgi:hypothetical protein